MARQPNGTLHWHLAEIGSALKITPEDVRLYFTDGRRVSFVLERRLAREVMNGTLAPSEGAGYDLLDASGGKWEVRSITKGGIYFCPSYMVGSGRSFNEAGFLSKMTDIRGYVVSDVESFPDVPFWIVPVESVKRWWRSGELGSGSKISRQKALKLLSELE
jgi:hypothetical protein